ncbi:MAG TPA: hypothetical protein HPP77_07140, partial [Candidatus Hydrogenedentes bacterium]|nr:hypothetical protein [Candidatus Hydrogenedentota bacterium]
MAMKTLVWLLCCAVLGCATTPEGNGAQNPERNEFDEPRKPARITLVEGNGRLGETVRQVGRQYPVGIVLMNGLGHLPMGKLSFRNVGFDAFAERLAAD